MKSFEPLLLAKVDVYLRQILQSNRESKKVNIAEKMRYLALDIVAKLGFGYDLATQTNENNRFLSKALGFGLYRANVWHHLFFLSKLWVHLTMDWILYESREKFSKLVEDMIRSRIAEGVDGDRDFYSYISKLASDEGKLRKGELWWEANFLLIAGG
jgi:cytochrome P450